MAKAREAWQRLYSRHGLQYGGSGDLGPLEPQLRQSMLVLDAGCGDGKNTIVLARKCDVVGCDFSREALVSLRTQRDYDRNVNLVECEIGHLPFESERFDAVSCTHTLSHMFGRDRQRSAVELDRVLKHDGLLMVEGFARSDIRYGDGEEVEESSFLRGNGIVTHYFTDGEIPALFPGVEVLSEIVTTRRVSYGPVAGRRATIRALMRKR